MKITYLQELLNSGIKNSNKITTTKDIKICKIDPVACIKKILIKTNFGYENNSQVIDNSYPQVINHYTQRKGNVY